MSLWVNSSGSKAADSLIYAQPGCMWGLVVATDGTNAVTFSIYDGRDTNGTLLLPTFITPTSATNRSQLYIFNLPIRFNTALYVDITCSGTVGYSVLYTTG